MKTKILFFLALFATVSTMAFSVGNDDPRTGMAVLAVKGSEVVKVIYKAANPGKVKLNIFDSQGKIILSEIINGTDGFIFPLNFKGLESGNYTFELIDGKGTQRETVLYQPSVGLNSIHIAKLTEGEGRFLLSIANSHKENVYVKIYDAADNLVFTENKEITGDFAQVYKIAKPGNSYTFEISDDAGNRKSFTF